jgi:hypothetical protein
MESETFDVDMDIDINIDIDMGIDALPMAKLRLNLRWGGAQLFSPSFLSHTTTDFQKLKLDETNPPSTTKKKPLPPSPPQFRQHHHIGRFWNYFFFLLSLSLLRSSYSPSPPFLVLRNNVQLTYRRASR